MSHNTRQWQYVIVSLILSFLLLFPMLYRHFTHLGKPDGSERHQIAEINANTAAPSGDAVNEEYGLAIEKCEFLKEPDTWPIVTITCSFTNPYDFEIPVDLALFLEVTQDGAELAPSFLYEPSSDSSKMPNYKDLENPDSSFKVSDIPGVAPGQRVEVEKSYIVTTDKDIDVSCEVLDKNSFDRIPAASRTFSIKEQYAGMWG